MAHRPDETPSPQETQIVVVPLRMTWLLAGPAAVALLLFFVAREATGFSAYDVGVAVALLITVGARYFDIAFYRGETGDGKPATMQHFRSYALQLIGGVGVVWVLIHAWRLL